MLFSSYNILNNIIHMLEKQASRFNFKMFIIYNILFSTTSVLPLIKLHCLLEICDMFLLTIELTCSDIYEIETCKLLSIFFYISG